MLLMLVQEITVKKVFGVQNGDDQLTIPPSTFNGLMMMEMKETEIEKVELVWMHMVKEVSTNQEWSI